MSQYINSASDDELSQILTEGVAFEMLHHAPPSVGVAEKFDQYQFVNEDDAQQAQHRNEENEKNNNIVKQISNLEISPSDKRDVNKRDKVYRQKVAMMIEQLRQNFKEYAQKMTDISPNKDGKIMKFLLHKGNGESIDEEKVVMYQYEISAGGQKHPLDSTSLMNTIAKTNLKSASLVPGMMLALKTMHCGEVADFILHPDYGYGMMGCPPRIPYNCYILLKMRLIGFSDEEIDIMDAMDEDERATLNAEKVERYVKIKMELAESLVKKNMFKSAHNRFLEASKHLLVEHYGWDIDEHRKMNTYAKEVLTGRIACLLEIGNLAEAEHELERLEFYSSIRPGFNVDNFTMAKLKAKTYFKQGHFERALQEMSSCPCDDVDIVQLTKMVKHAMEEYERNFREMAKRMFSKTGEKTRGDPKMKQPRLEEEVQIEPISDRFKDYVQKLVDGFNNDDVTEYLIDRSTMNHLEFQLLEQSIYDNGGSFALDEQYVHVFPNDY